MKHVILMKAKPYTRVRRGKLEHVKGYAGVRFSPALEEATVWQIGKDYGVSKEEARRMYKEMFAEEKPKAGLETRLAVTRGAMRGAEDPKDYKYFKEQEKRIEAMMRKPMKMVVAVRKPQIGDIVTWKRHSALGEIPDRPMQVIGFEKDMVVVRDPAAVKRGEYSGADLYIPPGDLVVAEKKETKEDFASKIEALRTLIEQQTKERFAKEYPKSYAIGNVPKARIKAGDKYIKIDVWYRDWETDRKSTRLNSSHRL